ncbi:MAG: histidine kinase [Bryobacteraceae bacterium]
MNSRTWPVLLIGFSALLMLSVVSGTTAIRKTNELHREVLTIQEHYRQYEKLLDEINSHVYLTSILVRDFLLDTSEITSEDYRIQLIGIRGSMEQDLGRLQKLTRKEDQPTLQNLKAEVEAYWKLLSPVFEWTLKDKLQKGPRFLQYDLRERRTAIVSITQEVGKLNSGNSERQYQNTRRSKERFHEDLRTMITATVLLGALVMGASIYQVARLERRSEREHLATQDAERALRDLSLRLVQAQEEERRSISRELHDEVGQVLTALRMELGNLDQLLPENSAAFREHLGEGKKLTEQSLRIVRDMAMGLRPSMLDDLGLGPAVEWQAREFSRRSGVPVTVELNGNLDHLADAHRTCIYRVVQEALTNCARHSRANRIWIVLRGREDGVSLRVQDDGTGFPAPDGNPRGLGLIGIEERVRELGGSVAIDSTPQRGTIVKIDIPVRTGVEA